MNQYVQLTLEERCEIHWLAKSGISMGEIGRRLPRDKSAISRELRRNGTYKRGEERGCPYIIELGF